MVLEALLNCFYSFAQRYCTLQRGSGCVAWPKPSGPSKGSVFCPWWLKTFKDYNFHKVTSFKVLRRKEVEADISKADHWFRRYMATICKNTLTKSRQVLIKQTKNKNKCQQFVYVWPFLRNTNLVPFNNYSNDCKANRLRQPSHDLKQWCWKRSIPTQRHTSRFTTTYTTFNDSWDVGRGSVQCDEAVSRKDDEIFASVTSNSS